MEDWDKQDAPCAAMEALCLDAIAALRFGTIVSEYFLLVAAYRPFGGSRAIGGEAVSLGWCVGTAAGAIGGLAFARGGSSVAAGVDRKACDGGSFGAGVAASGTGCLGGGVSTGGSGALTASLRSPGSRIVRPSLPVGVLLDFVPTRVLVALDGCFEAFNGFFEASACFCPSAAECLAVWSCRLNSATCPSKVVTLLWSASRFFVISSSVFCKFSVALRRVMLSVTGWLVALEALDAPRLLCCFGMKL